jgi:CHAD domain-containing protein
MLQNNNVVESTPDLLTPQISPRLCARPLILERIRELVKHEAGTRAGEDIEALHDMRVASRRLREALEIFQFCFPQKIYVRLYDRVRRVTRALGQARNADVAVDFFAKLLAASRDLIEQISLQDILRRLAKQQARRRAEMQNELDKVQPAGLAPRFEKAFDHLASIPLSRQRGSRTALQLARRLLAPRLREVFACRRLIKGENDAEGLHNLRIAVKKLRYAIETLDFAAGEHAKENLKFFKKLQTVLGELHDRDVFLEITQQRLDKLQKQSFTDHLLNGYQPILAKIRMQRQDFYAEYIKLFGHEKIQAWRSRIVPPPPAPTKSHNAPSIAEPALSTS